MSFEMFKQALNLAKYSFLNRDDNVGFKGVFEMQILDKNNNIIQEYKEDNIIVNNSYDIIADLFVDSDNDKRINTVKIGDGGVEKNAVNIPEAGETYLFNPWETLVTPSSYTNADVLKDRNNRSISLTWTLEQNEGNGPGYRVYNEAGLFSAEGTKFSKKKFSEVVKTADQRMVKKWNIRLR